VLSQQISTKFHFDSLGHDNDAQSSEIKSISHPLNAHNEDDKTPIPIILEGLQQVPKFNQQAPDTVQILMAVYRIEQKNTDLVVTFNIPKLVQQGSQIEEKTQLAAAEHFKIFVKSLQIVDLGLFA